MLPEVLAALAPRPGAAYLDATFGGGGYAGAILAAVDCTLWAIDRDPDAIARGAALAARFPGRLHLLHGSFGSLMAMLAERGVHQLDGVVMDLGLSSFQIDDPARGFSFRSDGPLDMRMDRTGPTAADLVAELPEAELADTLYQLGEERMSRRIARAIVLARAQAPIATTGQLAAIIRRVVPKDASGIDPATPARSRRCASASTTSWGRSSARWPPPRQLLAPGGRLVVVSFHSGEDRIVKHAMTEAAGQLPLPSRHDPRSLAGRAPAGFRLVGKRARRPTEAEIAGNPRARSARLRTLQRLPAIETECPV